MKIGPKFKIAKRLGAPIFEKTQTAKFAQAQARAGEKRLKRRPGQMSDFKRQLIEKQKMRYSYGITERQLSRYVAEAVEQGGDPAGTLVTRLESRLDNVVYRLGLAKTRALARQMVSHGHITVNGRKVTIPSFEVKVGEQIGVREGSRSSVLFTELAEKLAGSSTPAWLSFDVKAFEGSRTGNPETTGADYLFDTVQVLQFYSR